MAGLDLAGKDPKTAVNQFCQRYCSRPVTKECIVYQTSKFPTGHQCILRLNCIDGQEFAGEMHPTAKEAEQSACMQVLTFYADAIANMPTKKGKNKRPAGAAIGEPDAKIAATEGLMGVVPDPNASKTSKSELNTLFSKITRRVMAKGEVVYESLQVQGGFQATVKMPGMPDHWGTHVWAGEVCPTKADAEQSAAAIALAEIQTDPNFQEAMLAPTAKEKNAMNWKMKNANSGGKGKGKGKGHSQQLAMSMATGNFNNPFMAGYGGFS